MGFSPGEESRSDGVAVQAIEAQPIFGQIRPSEATCSRALNSILEKGLTDLVERDKGTRSARVEKEYLAEKRARVSSRGHGTTQRSLVHQVYSGRDEGGMS
jgi:hypothetical protein